MGGFAGLVLPCSCWDTSLSFCCLAFKKIHRVENAFLKLAVRSGHDGSCQLSDSAWIPSYDSPVFDRSVRQSHDHSRSFGPSNRYVALQHRHNSYKLIPLSRDRAPTRRIPALPPPPRPRPRQIPLSLNNLHAPHARPLPPNLQSPPRPHSRPHRPRPRTQPHPHSLPAPHPPS